MTAKTFSFLLLFLLSSITAVSQKNITNQSLYWLRYYNQLSINKKLTWHNEIDDRRFFDANKQHHLIMHSRLHYKFFQNVDAALGMTYSLQSPQDPASTSELVIPELRPVQEINIVNPVTKKFSLQHRFRIEERFIHKNDGKTLLDGYDFNFRFRYRLQVNYIISKIEEKKPLTLKIAEEIMVNAGEHIVYNSFDQNRLYVGFEKSLGKGFSAELGYLYWFQQRSSGNQYFERDIMRFTLYHKIKLN
jgi:Protein of unknown function (DUF2490)